MFKAIFGASLQDIVRLAVYSSDHQKAIKGLPLAQAKKLELELVIKLIRDQDFSEGLMGHKGREFMEHLEAIPDGDEMLLEFLRELSEHRPKMYAHFQLLCELEGDKNPLKQAVTN